MKSAFFILLCLTIQTIVQEGHSKQLMYFNEAKTWRGAERTCNECGGKLIEWNENTSEVISNSNLQKTIVWIGNYTIQNPWIVEKACITEEDLSDIPYYEINYNSPELCRRTCSDEQMFAVKGNQCHCVNVDEALKDLPCNGNDVKIYAVDYVFDCNFEKPCTNITFGQESSGLTWKKTGDFGTLDIGQIGREKGQYLLLQYLTPSTTAKARILIQLKLPDTYFCLSFKYYMYRDGSLEIFIFEKNGSKNFAWKKYGHEGHMWYSSTLDIKGHPSLMIEVLGAMENYNTYSRKSAVAIDDIKINSGSCNIERRLDCGFDESSCEWEQFSGFELVFNNYYFLKTQSNYGTIMSPNVYPYLAKEFCLRYVYYLFKDGGIYVKVNNQQIDSPTIFQKLKSVSTSFKARQKFNIEFEMQKSAIERITLRLGSCEQGINKEMCPVINIGDGARLSVDYCSKMINQTFICEFEDRQSLTNCTSGTEIIMKNKEKTTTTEEISSILTSIPQTSSDQMEQTSANSNTTNLPSISKETRKSPLETGNKKVIISQNLRLFDSTSVYRFHILEMYFD